MAPAPKTTRWKIEPHTRVKHLILQKYLEAWLPIMASHSGRIHFLDGFAGPGLYGGDEKGSPLIALETLINHPYFKKPLNHREVVLTFVEKGQARASALLAALATYKIPDWIKATVRQGEFAPLIESVLDKFDEEGKQLAPTLAFLDPFGFSGIPLEIIARIARNPRCECFITFMYEEINRFLSHPALGPQYDKLFGTPRWREILGEHDPVTRRDRIADLYRNQLQSGAGFGYVREFQMINKNNRTDYFLYFGTNHREGLSQMKQAMWKADPGGGSAFSDRTNPDQITLFQLEADLRALPKLLSGHFRDKGWIPIDAVEQFVLVETPFSEAMHLKVKTLRPMEKQSLIEARGPHGRRKGYFPPGTQIKFL
jgi:three-Cys-motif partner protein